MKIQPASIILAAGALGIGLGFGYQLGRGGGTNALRAASQLQEPVQLGAPRTSATREDDARVHDELKREYEGFKHVDRMFELVARAVRPTVVHIVTQKTSRQDEGQRVRKFEETGSGVIVRSEKAPGLFVLTNHHVVGGAKPNRIRVFLHDGRSLTPTEMWSDAMADVAVLKLDRDDLPSARFGDSDVVRIGSWVMALGSPFGLTHSVSQGIISARGRHMDELTDVENQDFLQTDAAINPGNSGGPLVNMLGEVVGVNNSIASSHGGNEGVGFSIPINLARWIMDELILRGRVSRGGLGIVLDPDFRSDKATARGLDRPRGALINRVYPDSPAARAGLRDGDVVLRFGGTPIQDLNHLINTVSMFPIGQPAELIVWRDARETKLRVTVEDRERTLAPANDPEAEPADAEAPTMTMGLELTTLDAATAADRGFPKSTHGALVAAVDPGGPLASICRAGDLIAAVNEQPIREAAEAARLLSREDVAPLLITIDRPADGRVERHVFRVP